MTDEPYIVIPILNNAVKTLRGPFLSLSEKVYIRTIDDVDFGFFLKDAPDVYKPLFSPRTKCIYLYTDKNTPFSGSIRENSILVIFTLNAFSNENPVSSIFSAKIDFTKQNKKRLILEENPFSVNHGKMKNKKFEFTENTTSEKLKAHYSVSMSACKNERKIVFTIEKFNQSLIRDDIKDGIIDICTCLESLVPGRSELKFKFSLFNSITSSNDEQERYNNFDLLSLLYDTRSGIVHGDSESRSVMDNIKKVSHEWYKIKEIAAKCINYRLFYSYEGNFDPWDIHLRKLALGSSRKIV